MVAVMCTVYVMVFRAQLKSLNDYLQFYMPDLASVASCFKLPYLSL